MVSHACLAGSTESGSDRVHALPAAGGALPDGGAREAPRLSRVGILGQAGPGLRRPGRPRADPRARARRTRLQPDGATVYRGLIGELHVPGAAFHRFRLPAERYAPGRRIEAE